MKAIIVGIDQWDKYTKPCIDSLLLHEPNIEVVVVDNGSKKHYPKDYGVKVLRLDNVVSYAKALNMGAEYGASHHQWYFFLNNDILFHKPFIDRFEEYCEDDTIYGFYTHEIKNGKPYEPYLPSFAMLMHSNLFYSVGKFDEEYKPMGYEDADICIRARRMGAKLKELDRVDFGIEHLARNDRMEKMPEECYRRLRRKLSV